MGQALYRKYRSKTLDEVVGQEHVTKTINNALKKGAISHAYLFTGPRGVGKTSVARILAHEINDLEYDESKNYLDIIEIDAASNRRIDEIRDLRDKVHTAPTSAKYKVYIIDEVHMLTKESFNALLKTLEEPPSHVVFILATTEAHKLPDTIISRTQHFTFKPIDEKLNAEHLQQIAKKEKIDVEPKAAALIARHGSGSFRDSISLLDQLRSITNDGISVLDVQKALGVAPDELITSILSAIDGGDASRLLNILGEAKIAGYNSAKIAAQLSAQLRDELITSSNNQASKFKLLKDLIAIPASDEPDTLLEIILLEALFANLGAVEPTKQRINPNTSETVEDLAEQPENAVELQTPTPVVIITDTETDESTTQNIVADNSDKDDWSQILDALKAKHNTLYSVARMAKCEITASKITLNFDFPFHYKRVMEPKNKSVLEETIHAVIGKKLELVCSLNNKTEVKTPANQTDIKDISNIFGDVEVLES